MSDYSFRHVGRLSRAAKILHQPRRGLQPPYHARVTFPKWNSLETSSAFHILNLRIDAHNSSVSFYRRHLPHFQRDYKPHFITFATKDRRTLPEWAREIVLESCVHGHQERYNLRIALVMPDHVHLILTPLVDCARRRMFKLYEIIGSIKKYSARQINQGQRCSGQVWQQESFDHVLRSESLDAKVAYILANPVRASLVNIPDEYCWKWERPNVM